MVAAGCPLIDVRSCMCTNVTLQSQLFLCVQANCTYPEQLSKSHVSSSRYHILRQTATTTLTQDSICIGVPQPSRSAEIIRIAIIVTAFTFPIIILRIVSRYTLTRLWWDDFIIIITAVSSMRCPVWYSNGSGRTLADFQFRYA